MKIYLAARFGRAEELRGYMKQLEEIGHKVTSRWLTQHQKLDLQDPNARYDGAQRKAFAIQDYEDVLDASCLIAFTEDPSDSILVPGGKRGGRHVELGIAIALNHETYIVGYRENVFCYLPHVDFYSDFPTLLEDLAP